MSEREDWVACDRRMSQYARMPSPAPRPRRRRHGRLFRAVELVIEHLDAEPESDDEPDDRDRTARDGSSIIVTSTASVLALDPDEIIGYDAAGYPETRAQRGERLKRQSSYQTFDRWGRPV